MTHAPGPWTAERNRYHDVSIYSDRKFIAYVYCDEDEPEPEIANVKLICAAPDMLAALEAVLWEDSGLACIEQVRDAIRKAKGEA